MANQILLVLAFIALLGGVCALIFAISDGSVSYTIEDADE